MSTRQRRPTPEPLDTNEVAVVGIGTALWAVALVVLVLLPAGVSPETRWWLWTCVAGIVGGLLALMYVRKRRHGIEKRQHRNEP